MFKNIGFSNKYVGSSQFVNPFFNEGKNEMNVVTMTIKTNIKFKFLFLVTNS